MSGGLRNFTRSLHLSDLFWVAMSTGLCTNSQKPSLAMSTGLFETLSLSHELLATCLLFPPLIGIMFFTGCDLRLPCHPPPSQTHNRSDQGNRTPRDQTSDRDAPKDESQTATTLWVPCAVCEFAALPVFGLEPSLCWVAPLQATGLPKDFALVAVEEREHLHLLLDNCENLDETQKETIFEEIVRVETAYCVRSP